MEKQYTNFPALYTISITEENELKLVLPYQDMPSVFDFWQKNYKKLYEFSKDNYDFIFDIHKAVNVDSRIMGLVKGSMITDIIHLIRTISHGEIEYINDIYFSNLEKTYTIYDNLSHTMRYVGAIEVTFDFIDRETMMSFKDYCVDYITSGKKKPDDIEDWRFSLFGMLSGISEYAYMNCYYFFKIYYDALEYNDPIKYTDSILDEDTKEEIMDRNFVPEKLIDILCRNSDMFDMQFIVLFGIYPIFKLYYNNEVSDIFCLNIRDWDGIKFDEENLIIPKDLYAAVLINPYLAPNTLAACLIEPLVNDIVLEKVGKQIKFMKEKYYRVGVGLYLPSYINLKSTVLILLKCSERIHREMSIWYSTNKGKDKSELWNNISKVIEVEEPEPEQQELEDISTDDLNPNIKSMINNIVSGKPIY